MYLGFLKFFAFSAKWANMPVSDHVAGEVNRAPADAGDRAAEAMDSCAVVAKRVRFNRCKLDLAADLARYFHRRARRRANDAFDLGLIDVSLPSSRR